MAFYFLLLYLSGDDSELELLQLHQLDNSQASTVVGSPLSSLPTPCSPGLRREVLRPILVPLMRGEWR